MGKTVIGYTDFWQKNIGSPLNKAFESGPMSKTSQTFKWTEKVKLLDFFITSLYYILF